MRVTFVLPSRTVGGGTRVVFQHANRLLEKGHNVTVVYPELPPYLLDLLRTKGLLDLSKSWVQTREHGDEIEWSLDAIVVSVPSLSYGVERLFWDRIPDADAVVTASWRTVGAVERFPESKGRPYHLVQDYEVWDLWNSDACWSAAEQLADDAESVCLSMYEVEPSEDHLVRQKNRVDKALNSPVAKLPVSPWLGELIKEKVGRDVAGIVPNGVDTEVFYPDEAPPESIGWPPESVRIVAPGRTPQYKGLHTLFDALERVEPDVETVLYGNVPTPLPDGVTAAGRVTDAELRRLYSSADLFVGPSHAEGWGLPSTEAAACGTAVVSTETGWVRDYPEVKGISGVPPRDPAALADAIQELARNPDRRESMGDAVREAILRRFTAERSTDRLERTLQECP